MLQIKLSITVLFIIGKASLCIAETVAPSEEPTKAEESVESPVADIEKHDEKVDSTPNQAELPISSSLLSAKTGEADDDNSEKEGITQIVGALKSEPGLRVRSQLAGLFQYQDNSLKPSNEFRISRARIELTWTQWKLISAKVKVEAKELFRGGSLSSILRDVYVRVQPLPEIGLRLGQFKKPFSKSALLSRNTLPFVKRGISNKYISNRLLYGGRDIGAMLEGRLWKEKKLDYKLGIFNGMGRNTTEIGLDGTKDLVARLEAEPVRWFDVGLSASFKFIEKADLPGFVNRNNFLEVEEEEYPFGYSDADFISEHEWMTGVSWMTSADVVFTPNKWRIVAEGMLGENWWFKKYPMIWSALMLVSYKHKLKKGVPLWIEPAIKGETYTFMTSDMKNWRVRLWQLTPAVNLHIGKHVRLMIDGEFVFAQGEESDIDGSRRSGLWPNEFSGDFSDSKRLLVQLAFGI